MQWLEFSETEANPFLSYQRFITEKITTLFAISPAMLGVETMTPIEETVDPESAAAYQEHPNCRCDLSPTGDTQEDTQEPSQEEATPVSVRWEGHWNFETGRAEWQRIEEPIIVKPKPLEQAKYNHAGRRNIRQYLRRLYRKAYRRQAEVQPATCPRCMAPMLGMRFNRYDTTPDGVPGKTVIGTALWRCQCQPQRQLRRARYACDMCHVELWQTTEERTQNTVCEACGEDLRKLWQADADSASEAMCRATELRTEDDEMHRAAQKAAV